MGCKNKSGVLNKVRLRRKGNTVDFTVISKKYTNITKKNIVTIDRELIDINLLDKIIYRGSSYTRNKLDGLLDFSLDVYNINGEVDNLKNDLILVYHNILDKFLVKYDINEIIKEIEEKFTYIGNDRLYDNYEILNVDTHGCIY